MALTKITPQMFDTSAAGHDFNIDNGTFVVDASANRVGIGTSSPSTLLHVDGTLTATSIAGTLTTAAQTNITSLGTLTGLTMSGALNMGNQLLTNVGATITFSTSVDGTINFPSTGRINFDSDNNSTGEDFIIGSNRTAGSGGNEHLRITAAGNVGIGNDSPSAKLDVVANNTVWAGEFTQSNTSNGDGVIVTVGSTAAADYALSIRSDAGNTGAFNVKANGNVGIGEFSPDRKLHIKDSGQIKLENTGTTGWAGLDIHTSVGTNNYDMYMGMLDSNGRFFIDVDSNGEDFTILQNGNVGIGTGANVDELLHLEKSSGTTLVKTEVASNSTVGLEIAKTGSTNQRWRIVDGQTVNGTLEIHDATNSATRMAIDQSGNFLLGTTNTTWASQEGVRYFNGDSLVVTRSGGDALYVNRLSSDGAIASFYKDGTSVGAISTWSGNPAFGRLNCALLFDDDVNRIKPASVQSNTARDNVIDLGDPSHRFNDMWLGGGIHLGGTGSANKLDDYEEGTWTPTLIAGTTNPTGGGALAPSGTYTKIGNRVWLTFYVGRSWTNSPSGTVYVGNFPFTVHSTSPNYYSATATTYNVNFGTANIPFWIPSAGYTNAALYTASNSGTWSALTWQSHMSSSSGSYVSGMIHFVVA